MHKVDNSARPPSHVDSQDNPDERLKLTLQRIAERDYEEPEERVHERSDAVAERLSLELPRLTLLARVPREPQQRRDQFEYTVLNVVLDAWQNNDAREAASKLPSPFGGSLTLDQNRGTGSLIEAIEILRPCLPEGFVPKALPLKTMQRIKTQVARRR